MLITRNIIKGRVGPEERIIIPAYAMRKSIAHQSDWVWISEAKICK